MENTTPYTGMWKMMQKHERNRYKIALFSVRSHPQPAPHSSTHHQQIQLAGGPWGVGCRGRGRSPRGRQYSTARAILNPNLQHSTSNIISDNWWRNVMNLEGFRRFIRRFLGPTNVINFGLISSISIDFKLILGPKYSIGQFINLSTFWAHFGVFLSQVKPNLRFHSEICAHLKSPF